MQLVDRGAARARRDRDVAYGLCNFSSFYRADSGRRGPDAQAGHEHVRWDDVLGRRNGNKLTYDGVYKKRPGSQKRAFQKVDARDLAGKWCGGACIPFVPFWPFTSLVCTRKKALNEDQYAESGLICCLALPIPFSGTRTRKYVNGHPTNGFVNDGPPHEIHWHRDPGCAAGNSFSKKLC